jgi:anti-sigma regulatory factor (Ser/Thr protein kinase)
MTVASATRRLVARPRVLMPLPNGALLPDERAAMMAWQRNCLRLQVPAMAANVRRVRHAAERHVLDVFAADPLSPGPQIADFAYTIELLVSELVTNAVRYKRAPDGLITLELSSSTEELPSWARRPGMRPTPAAVKLSVEDDNPKPPPSAPSAPMGYEDENGRGLMLLYAHSIYADAVPAKAGRKRVRALVLVPTAALAQEKARQGRSDR